MAKRVLISICVWTSSTILTVLLYFSMLGTIALFPFDKQRRRAHAQCYWWSDAVIALNPYWKINVSGLENIDHSKTYVVVANHQSLADIAILYQTKMQHKWVAKESLFRVPFVGWSLSLCKHIRIARGELGSIKQVYKEAATWLRGGMSVLFFPEGTRSEDGKMKEFQNGAFKLAIREKVPILPIRIEGTGDAVPKGTWLFNAKAPSRIRVLPAIDTTGFENADFAKLRDMARSMIESA